MNITKARRLAVIDIGSNAVRLLIGIIADDGKLLTEVFTRLPLGLGGALRDGERRIDDALLERLQQTIAGMRLFIDVMQPAAFRAVATAAVRDAANCQAVCAAVSERCGVQIDVLSGEEEAALIGCFVAAQFTDASTVLNIDVGGGSSDCALLENGTLLQAATFAVGMRRADNGNAAEKTRFSEWLKQASNGRKNMVVSGSGGSVRALATQCGEITATALTALQEKLDALTPLAIAKRYNLSPDRAHNINAAVRIYHLVLTATGGTMQPVSGGLAEAALREL